MAKAHERAYGAIKEGILSGEFPPGYQLKEEALAESLKISRSPIRQAIRTLVQHGFVENRPNGRSHVVNLDRERFNQQLDLLEVLESYSVGLAIENATPEFIEKLKGLNAQMHKATAPDKKLEFMALNNDFHKAIQAQSGSQVVQEFLQRLAAFPHNLYYKFGEIPDWHTSRAVVEHDKIIEALESGDAKFAKLCMEMHTQSVRLAFSELLVDEQPQQDPDEVARAYQ